MSLRKSPKSHICGGTIIKENWILTAAHCVIRWKPEDITIRFGMTGFKELEENVASVNKIIVHENFGRKYSGINDIALLRLSNSLSYQTGKIEPVSLPPQGYELPYNNLKAFTLGWGFNEVSCRSTYMLDIFNPKVFSEPWDESGLFTGSAFKSLF